ncbi:MAG: ATP-binding cassette domain-containing protein [Bilifractor sp.]
MIQIKDLTIIHRKDLRTLIADFQLVLKDGDKAVIIGEEGNGKSTLLQWIYNPERIAGYADASGVRILGEAKTAFLPQELEQEDRTKTVYEFFSEEEAFLLQTPGDLGRMAKDFGTEADFYYLNQRMETLSGGEKIKAQLMRILMGNPDVLLLDEPSNDVDLDTLRLLENLIRGWKKIVLFISHDEALISHTANMVIHLEQIRRKTLPRYTIKHLSYGEYVKSREDLFTAQERQALNERREKQKRDAKYHRILQGVSSAQNAGSRQDPHSAALLKKKMHSVKSMGRRFEKLDADMTDIPDREEAIGFRMDTGERIPEGKTVLDYSADELRSPDGEKILARNVRLLVRGPEKICIIGKNGAGKTTLIRDIAGEFMKRSDLHAEYMPQNYEDGLDPEQTPVSYLASEGAREEETRIRTYLGSLKFTPDEMDHPIGGLSGGQRAKLFLLKMSISHADVLILDEPTRNLSPLSGPVIRKMLRKFGGAIISVSHDKRYIEEVCSRVVLLTENGLTDAELQK